MKKLIVLLIVVFGLAFSASAQTNIIHISNSRVTINNIVMSSSTNNVTSVTTTNDAPKPKMVLLSPEAVDRLNWEYMLYDRQQAIFQAYLRRIR